MQLLKILALEPDDLQVISTHLQDAIITIGDINYSPPSRQFVLLANRFAGTGNNKGVRARTGITFSQVSNVRSRKIRQGAPEAVLSLLAVEFVPGENSPEGTIQLIFSGGGTIQLGVECVEVQLEDLGTRWETNNIPTHDQE